MTLSCTHIYTGQKATAPQSRQQITMQYIHIHRYIECISVTETLFLFVFLWRYHRKKYCGVYGINHGRRCGTELTLVSLYSTELTRYSSWFLEYKLARVNSGAIWVPMINSPYIRYVCWWSLSGTLNIWLHSIDGHGKFYVIEINVVEKSIYWLLNFHVLREFPCYPICKDYVALFYLKAESCTITWLQLLPLDHAILE